MTLAVPTTTLAADLERTMTADAAGLRKRMSRLRKERAPESEWLKLAQAVSASAARAHQRELALPAISFPEELPVSARRDEIATAIRNHAVVIVSGETGSGKTTQLPKICLSIGRGVRGLIGHTQPRRIAARTVANRIAQELATEPGAAVGYKVRFSDHTRPDAYIKLMTDGILLAETQRDPLLLAYDTIIVDEAHERSLNIDFMLGYLRQLLPRRPDLKIIITSATLDAERFARHFREGDDDNGTDAPIIEVSGRTYPVEIRYRAPADEADDDEAPLEEAIVSAAEDLWREAPGDILVFLPGEREIRETADLLRKSLAARPYSRHVEILTLYARLAVADQQRVFSPSNGRRIVLATNVAETSLTVPGIRYVIDSGLARIKRYSLRNKVTLLQIEKVSQASANQRAGRCGRVAAGICVRLYAEEDFAKRPLYTEPEILRSSLAAVILRMAALRLGDVAAFPFVEAPTPRAIADGYQLLQELGAVDDRRELTPLGKELARLPVDPRIGRMILAGRAENCLPEVLVIASALAIPDPRERPLDKQQAADQAHLRFRDERSDFLSLLALWQFFAETLDRKLSHRKAVDACRAHFVSYLRLSEWRDLHRQLAEQLAELGWRWTDTLAEHIDNPRYAAIHRALLAGLLSSVGVKSDEDEWYLGARGIRFLVHPGSGIARKGAKWILAAELTETTRLYARCAARVDPDSIERVAGDLVDRDYFDPRWNKERGEVVASERVSLYGLTLVPRRPVSYGRIDPEAARQVFVREALAAGELVTSAPFLAHNQSLVREIGLLEHKARRQDVLVDEETIAAFYADRIPAGVNTAAAFERWRIDAEARDPKILHMTREALMRHAASHVTEEQYPERIEMAGTRLPLKYRFAPGHPLDGLTLTVPLALLNQLDEARLSWLVPGMVREKIGAYLKSLPKAWRNRLVPLPDTVTAFLEQLPPGTSESLPDALRAFCSKRIGEPLPADVWARAELPPHLQVNVCVVDAGGRELAQGRDLALLRAQLGEAAQLSFSTAGPEFERSGIKTWDFGDLPETLVVTRQGRKVIGYPALVVQEDDVALKLLDTAAAAESATRVAVIRLIRTQLRDALKRWEGSAGGGPPGFMQAALQLKTSIPSNALLADVVSAICDRAFIGDDPLPRTESAFAEQVKRARARLPAVAESAFRLLAAISAAHYALSQRIGSAPRAAAPIVPALRSARDHLVCTGFFSATPWDKLAHIPRYLAALERRLVKYADDPARDARHAREVAALEERWRERVESNRKQHRVEPKLDEFRWMLEELKVSLFAQELRTPVPVSYKRLEKAWTELLRG